MGAPEKSQASASSMQVSLALLQLKEINFRSCCLVVDFEAVGLPFKVLIIGFVLCLVKL